MFTWNETKLKEKKKRINTWTFLTPIKLFSCFFCQFSSWGDANAVFNWLVPCPLLYCTYTFFFFFRETKHTRDKWPLNRKTFACTVKEPCCSQRPWALLIILQTRRADPRPSVLFLRNIPSPTGRPVRFCQSVKRLKLWVLNSFSALRLTETEPLKCPDSAARPQFEARPHKSSSFSTWGIYPEGLDPSDRHRVLSQEGAASTKVERLQINWLKKKKKSNKQNESCIIVQTQRAAGQPGGAPVQ